MAERADFIEFRALTKIFEQENGRDVEVIDPLDLSIGEGEFVVFVGPSGCGKTTVMRMVGGLETPTTGDVLLEGKPVTGPSREKGMVFQSYSSFPWLTVLSNIRFGLRYRRDVTEAEKATRPPARHRLVQEHAGRKLLYIASHASHIATQSSHVGAIGF